MHISTPKVERNTKPVVKESYGQPTPWTHPHIVRENEVVNGISLKEFQMRRSRLVESVQKHSMRNNPNLTNHLVIIPSATKKYMSDKIPYVFRQNSDFLYLSGCLEPDSVLALSIDQKEEPTAILFMRPKDNHAELWDGTRTGVSNAIEYFGVDEAYDVDDFGNYMQKYMTKPKPLTIWYDKKVSELPDITQAISSRINSFESPTLFIHKQRVIKSPAEIKLMRKTCEIASESINRTIKESKPGDSEHHIFAKVDYYCRMKNANFLAYPPVVAAGNNATTIHYINNCQIAKNGDLVLMDAGCEYGGYTSDITRTWPINGSFSQAQTILYQVILELQQKLIDTLLKKGGQTLDELFDTMCVEMGLSLQEVGLISKKKKGIELAKAAYNFCPHHVSHYLGMDVHDTPYISRGTVLQPGMICTVEPGIYIAADRTDVPEEFRGVGIRIEDDVLIVNDSEVEVLTKNCVKDLKTIENCINDL